MNKSYSKIRHIQESNQRLEKRLLNEQEGVSGKHSTFLNLVTKLKPYGFIEDKRMEQMLGKGFLILSKGDDTNGIQIMFNVNNVTWSWSVVQNGVAKVNKERKIEGDYSIIDKIEGIIMNDIKPYISMKVKPTFNEQIGGRDIHELTINEIDEYIKWDIKTVDCEGSRFGNMSSMGVDYKDDVAIVTIRYCKGDHEELVYLKKKAKYQIDTENKLPDDDGDKYDF